jgi:molybdenum cofactor guanylyltransferase
MLCDGALLTGGASRRMGSPKAALPWSGGSLAQRAADALAATCSVAIEVGPGFTTLERVDEPTPSEGPLGALVAAIVRLEMCRPLILLACDLPLVDAASLAALCASPDPRSVVPVDVDGVAQTVCARYSTSTQALAVDAFERGERSLKVLLEGADVVVVPGVVRPELLVDIDTPAEAAALGITPDGRN